MLFEGVYMTTKLEELLIKAVKMDSKIAAAAREYYMSQAEVWKKIPYEALMADGRGGFSPLFNTAYTMGYWDTYSYGIYIDLADGRLIDRYSAWSETPIEASDEMVATFCREYGIIDAAQELERIRRLQNRTELQDNWEQGRIEMITNLHLNCVYTRTVVLQNREEAL
jgi:hypothetical protein